MDRDELFVPETGTDTYEPQVVVTKKTEQESAAFWNQLVNEADESDAADLAAWRRARGAGEKGAEAADAGALANPEADALADATEVEASETDALADTDTPAPASFEERYEKLLGVITNKPSHRELLLRVLRLCRQPQEFGAVEAAIQEFPEFPAADQNPYRLITFLVDGGGLEQLSVDSEGNPITAERAAGLTEDELDDLIDCFQLRTTDVGRQVADDFSTERRLKDLFLSFNDRVPFYTELLEFCKQPRAFKEIESLFAGRDLSALRTLHPESGLAIKPSVFVDNMEKAGAIVWKKDGWVLTKEGGAYLEAITKALH